MFIMLEVVKEATGRAVGGGAGDDGGSVDAHEPER